MKLLVGLGNPGLQYERTRHNVGFIILDKLADQLHLGEWKRQGILFDSEILSGEVAGEKVVLMKPGTFVNRSGLAIQKYIADHQTDLDDIWVIHDDTEVMLGEVRVKNGGTSGGHNGIKSIDEEVGDTYWRIRVGVGRPEEPIDLADHVLAKFGASELEDVTSVIDQTVTYLVKSLEEGIINPTTFNAKEQKN